MAEDAGGAGPAAGPPYSPVPTNRAKARNYHRPRAAAHGININRNYDALYPFERMPYQYSWAVAALRKRASAAPATPVHFRAAPSKRNKYFAFKPNIKVTAAPAPGHPIRGTLVKKTLTGKIFRVEDVVLHHAAVDAEGNRYWLIGRAGSTPDTATPFSESTMDMAWSFYTPAAAAAPVAAAGGEGGAAAGHQAAALPAIAEENEGAAEGNGTRRSRFRRSLRRSRLRRPRRRTRARRV